MRILVTGGMGLIGHNVVKKLLDRGHKVLIVDTMTNYGFIPKDEMNHLFAQRSKKITDQVPLVMLDIVDSGLDVHFTSFKPELVMHLASFPRQKVVNANPQLGAKTMCEGLLNLLELSVTHRVEKFMYVSSSMVYGDFNHSISEDEPCNPQGQYGIMKYMGEKLVKDYERKGHFKTLIIRPSAVYGPLDVEDRVISKFILTAMRGGVLNVNGEFERLDFTYVDDTAEGMVQAITSDATWGNTYNITKGADHTLLDAAKLAIKIVGKGDIRVRQKDADFPSRAGLNISAAIADFGYEPKVNIETGFQRYFEWFSNDEYWQGRLTQ